MCCDRIPDGKNVCTIDIYQTMTAVYGATNLPGHAVDKLSQPGYTASSSCGQTGSC